MKTFKELFISEANLTGKTMKLKKDYGEYKKGTEVEVLEFKGSGQYRVQFPDKNTDVIGVSALGESQVLDEKATWNHAEVAAQDVFNDLKSSGYNVKKSGNNGLKIIHDNGCVGTVVFDPSLKESVKVATLAESTDMIVRDYGKPSPKNKEFKKDYIIIFKNKKHGKYFDAWNYDLGFEANISQEEIDNETKPVSSTEADTFIKYMKSQEESV